MEKLVRLGYSVKVLDNLSKGRKENLTKIIDKVELVYGDVRDADVASRAVNGADAVVHLAALTDVQESMEKPLPYHEVNSSGTLNLLNSAKGRVKRFILASSCAVYGNPVRLPIAEDHPASPLSPYAESKLSAENHCKVFSESYGLKTTILRLFNVYGPRHTANQYSGVITEFMNRIRTSQPPLIHGDGAQTRDFIFVEDVVDLIIRAIESEIDGTFNVGTGNAVSIKQLAELLLRLMNRADLKPIHSDPRSGDIRHSRADIFRVKKAFDFAPKVPLEVGLGKTIEVIR